jgi:hypothetical protein
MFHGIAPPKPIGAFMKRSLIESEDTFGQEDRPASSLHMRYRAPARRLNRTSVTDGETWVTLLKLLN